MNTTNLMPRGRQQQRSCRLRLRAWGGVCGSLALLLAGGGIWCFAIARLGAAPVSDVLRASQDVAHLLEQQKAISADLAAAQNEAQSVRLISGQPDWSLLLQMVSQSMDDEIVLKSCDLAREPDAPISPAEIHPAASAARTAGVVQTELATRGQLLTLRLSGFGRSQAAVSRFVLRLESAEIFERVTFLQSSRQPLLAGEAIGFQLECPLRPSERGAK